MPGRDDILGALAEVIDPFLHKPVTDLGLVKEAEAVGESARVKIALPVADRDWAERLEAELRSTPGLEQAHLQFTVMDDDEATALRERLSPAGSTSPLMDPAARTRVIAVSSGKGGVGKSSVTVNVAIQLAKAGKQVAVIDADVWGFSIPLMLGVDRPPIALDGLIVPPVSYGVALISIGFFVEEGEPVIWRGPMLHKALEQFITDVYWGDPDYLVIDMPPGTGDVSLSMSQFLPRAEVIVVTTPQPAAQTVAERAAAMARKVNLPVLGVIENMSWFTGNDGERYRIFGEGGGQVLADHLQVPLLGQVPLEPELREGGDAGRPISVFDPDAEAAQAFATIARRIDELGPRKRRRPGLSVRPV